METDPPEDTSSESGGDSLCEEELPASGEPFTFELVNHRAEAVFLEAGCSVGPIRLRMAGGDFHLTPPSSVCGFDCRRIHEGGEHNPGCSDCGSATDTVIQAGASRTFDWDRRYFVEHMAPDECAPPPLYPDDPEATRHCGLGLAVDPAVAREIVFRICLETEEVDPWGEICAGAWEEVIVALDLSSDSLTIDID